MRTYDRGGRDAASEARTDAAVSAACELLCSKGIDGLTFDAVAERAQLSRRAVFNRFQTKAALIEAMFDRIATIGNAPNLAEPAKETNGHAAIAAFVRASFDLWNASPDLTRRLVALSRLDDGVARLLAEREGRRIRSIEALVAQLADLGVLRKDPAAATALLSTFVGFDACDKLRSQVGDAAARELVTDLLQIALLRD